MKALIIYDSWYHNTEQIADAIKQALGNDAKAVNLHEGRRPEIGKIDLLIIGSPTHGGVPTPAIKDYLDSLKTNSLYGVSVATFDTRVEQKWVKLIGFAAKRIGRTLKVKAGSLVGTEGFYVVGKEGPLKAGELARAKEWANSLVSLVKHNQMVGV